MFYKLLDAVLVSPPWVALAPMTLHGDSIEELTQYMKAVHSDHMACPVKLCSRIMASMLTGLDLSKTSMFVTMSCNLMPMINLRNLMWKHSCCLMCFLYRVHIPQSYRDWRVLLLYTPYSWLSAWCSCGSPHGNIGNQANDWLHWFEPCLCIEKALRRNYASQLFEVVDLFQLSAIYIFVHRSGCWPWSRLVHNLSLAETDCETKEARDLGEPAYYGLKVIFWVCYESAVISKQSLHGESLKSPGPCIQPSEIEYKPSSLYPR